MLASPLVLPLAAGDKSLPLINNDQYGGEYYLRETLVSYRVKVRHSNFTKNGQTYDRHNITCVKTTFAVGAVPEFENQCSVTISCLPADSFIEVHNATLGWLETSVNIKAASNANLIKILGWES